MTLQEAIIKIRPLDKEAMAEAKKHWDKIAKPLHSLGKLETIITRLVGMTGNLEISLKKRALAIFCADNGIVARGVTQTDSSVTAIVAENFTKGKTSVCLMAQYANTHIVPIDIGIKKDMDCSGLLNRKLMYGTEDFTITSAMTREVAVSAIEVGIQIAIDLVDQGYQIIATGEMGIGNTTTSSAIATVLLRLPVAEVTGVGAGLDSEGLKRKIAAIEQGIYINNPNPADAIDVLAKVGGLDIAGIAGLFIGGALKGVPVVIDGFISAVGALIAYKIAPLCLEYMVASHVSAEPAGRLLLNYLGLSPMITCDMCLGEGSGAVAVLPLLDMGLMVYHSMSTFEEIKVDQYLDYTELEE